MTSSVAATSTHPARPSWWGRIARWALYALVLVYFLATLGYLGLRYLVWPNLDDWRPRIVAHLSEVLGRPVSVGAIESGFSGWRPALQIRDLRLAQARGSPVPGESQKPDAAQRPGETQKPGDTPKPVLLIPKLDAVISFRTFLTGQMRFARLQLTGPELDVHRSADGKLHVAGVQMGESNPEFAKRFAVFLAQRHLSVREGTLNWRDDLLGQSQVLAGVDVDIHSFGLRHKIDVKARQFGGLARNFEVTADLFRIRGVPVDNWRQWHGDVYAAADHLVADAIGAALGTKLPIRSAQGALRFWADLEEGALNNLQLKLSGHSMRIDLPEESSLLLERFGAEASAVRRANGGLEVVVRSLFGQTDSGFAVRALGNQTVTTAADGSLLEANLAIEDVGVAGALALLKRLPLPAQLSGVLASLKGRGQLRGLRMSYLNQARPEFDVNLSFDQLSLTHPAEPSKPGLPSVENVSGTATIKADGGQIQFNGKNSALTFPGLFDEPRIPFDAIKGKVDWQIRKTAEADSLEVAVEQLEFSNADAAGAANGRFLKSAATPGRLDLRGTLSRGDATRVARYLPSRLPPKVREWVGASIRTGKISKAQFSVKGELSNFPFRDPADGEFVIEAHVLDTTLAYAPEWPAIEAMRGVVRFAQGGMDIQVQQGNTYDVALTDGQARIADFRESVLTVDTQGKGQLRDMVRFVNESPVAKKINEFTKDTVAEGDALLKLRLELPLLSLKDSVVNGTLDFNHNDLQLDASIPKFDAVSGKMAFSNAGLSLTDINAGFLGGTLKLDAESPEPDRMQIRASGTISAENLRALADNPLTRKLSGRTDYRATVEVLKRNAKLTIDSNLVGLASDLPEPFRKGAEQAWPLQVIVKPNAPADPQERANGDQIIATLNEKSHLLFERSRDAASRKMLIRRGAFAYDSQAVLAEQGFVVLVNRNNINLDRWLDLLTAPNMQVSSDQGAGVFAPGFSFLPSVVSIVSDQLTVAGKDLHEVVFGASRNQGFWRANVSSRELSGYFNWSAAREGQRIGALTARFTRLEIPASRRSEIEDLIESSPQELPSLDIAAEELVLSERSLGRLSLKASTGGTPEFPTWRLNSLQIENPDAKLSASGVWEPPRPGEARKTRLDYQLEVADSGELLARYGMKNVIKAGAGSLSGSLSWDGSPLGLQLATLGGKTDIKLGKGQFLKTEPGLAKLISVLNLQFLPRRLSLDFSDVFAEGFSFDEIEGSVTISKGQARTEALEMKGAQAKVLLKGDVNLPDETQKLEVSVRPELNAGVASLAYAALANPALGLTSYIAQLLLRRPLEDLFTYNYDVTGTWSDPKVVERRSPAAGPVELNR